MDTTLTTPTQRYQRSKARLEEALRNVVKSALAPPTNLSVSEWADEFAYLSAETSADAGKFKCFGYQRGMLDAISDPSVKQVTVVKSARCGFTKCLDHVIGFYIHQDPAPILVVQPRVEDAEDYSRSEIAPMLRDTPVLAEIVGDLKAKDSSQRVAKRMFRNGASVSFVGANSPGGFRRITARVVLFDEVDGYPVSGAGDEGDQIALGIKRTETFWNRKVVLGSTPTIKHISRIERSFEESDKRRYHVPCPHCGEKQVLSWKNIRWDKEKDEDGNTTTHKPETAYFMCEHNGCVIEEHHKPWMIDSGEWIAEGEFTGHAGFAIWAAYSLFPNACWAELVREFLRCRKDPALLQTFVNLILGETWEETAEKVDPSNLITRVENYDRDTIPETVKALTAGVDVQDNRLELLVVGWGAREESWVIAHETILGDPAQPEVWADLDRLLLERYHTEDGRTMRIRTAAIDIGGHHTERVYAFTRDRHRRGVYAIKGMAGPLPIWPKKAGKGGLKKNDTFYGVGVDSAKDAIYARLRIERPGPGYIHFAVGECDENFFKQLTAEHVVTRFKKGKPYREWVLPGGRRNEALDLFVYAFAALRSTTLRLDRMEAPATPKNEDGTPAPVAIVPDELKPIVKEIVMKPPVSPQQYRPAPQRSVNPFIKGKSWFGSK